MRIQASSKESATANSIFVRNATNGAIELALIRLLGAFLLAILLTAPRGAAAEAPDEDEWTFLVAPYIYLPSMSGSATVMGIEMPIDNSIADLFTENDFVFAIQAQTEAWYRKEWGAIFNATWMILKQEDRPLPGPLPVDPRYDLKVNTGYFELFAAYDPFGERPFGDSGGPTWQVQPLVGFRVTAMWADLDIEGTPKINASEVWVDPLLGARGKLSFGNDNRWSFISRVDFGGFGAGSDFTIQQGMVK